jgi:hypothetical protein
MKITTAKQLQKRIKTDENGKKYADITGNDISSQIFEIFPDVEIRNIGKIIPAKAVKTVHRERKQAQINDINKEAGKFLLMLKRINALHETNYWCTGQTKDPISYFIMHLQGYTANQSTYQYINNPTCTATVFNKHQEKLELLKEFMASFEELLNTPEFKKNRKLLEKLYEYPPKKQIKYRVDKQDVEDKKLSSERIGKFINKNRGILERLKNK